MMEMIEKAAEKPQLIRGKIVAGFGRCSYMSMDIDDMEKHGGNYAVAVTKWYRHDDDLSRLERDINFLSRALSNGHHCDYAGAMIGIETKPYER